MTLPKPVYIVAAKRTPIGSYLGVYSGIKARLRLKA